MATWTPTTESSSPTWTKADESGAGGINYGMPIGLLLAITYGADPALTWTTTSESSAGTWTKINES